VLSKSGESHSKDYEDCYLLEYVTLEPGKLINLTGNILTSNANYCICINLLTPNVNYSGRTAPLTSKVAFHIFIQQIQVLNILNMVYNLRFFLFKMQFVS